MKIRFEKAAPEHVELIFSWLEEPHMQEFWDNSKEHKEDILNFINGLKQHYFYGTTKYWIAYMDTEPYAFVLSDLLEKDMDDLTQVHREHMSQNGHTISLDFGIGNKMYLGKGLGAPTLQAFMDFYKNTIDHKADTYFIDPNDDNPRAIHVYARAGFKKVGDYDVTKGAFIGDKSYIMVKKTDFSQAKHE